MSETKEEEIDLSHYDLIDGFSAHDVAYLIAGADPTEDPNVLIGLQPVWGRIVAAQIAVEQAHQRARHALYGAIGDYEIGTATEIKCPWWRTENGYPPYTKCLPDSEMWGALNELQKDPDHPIMPDGADTPTDKAVFWREDIYNWLVSTGYTGARYFWTEQDRQKESGATEADRASEQKEIVRLKAEVSRLQFELAQVGESASDEVRPGDKEKLLRQIGLLALLLSEKSGKYSVGEKPNASQIAKGAQDLLDASLDVSKRGLGDSSLRDSISKGMALLIR